MFRAPRTLAGRLFLILTGGMALAVALTYTLVRIERARELSQFRLRTDAERIGSVIRLLDALPADARPAALQAMERQRGVRELPIAAKTDGAGEPVPALAEALGSFLGAERPVALWRVREEPCRFPRAGPSVEAQPHLGAVDCRVVVYDTRLHLSDGTPLSLEVPLRSLRPEPPFLLRPYALALFVALLAASALLAVRVATRPLRDLVSAADALGRDIERPPLVQQGPREVQVAAKALNAMQSRIRSHMEERTHMLAAITHDLKTPLTRMRLRLEQVPNAELKSRLAQDVAAMQSLIDDGLELARSLDDKTPFVELDLRSLVDSVCADALDAGMPVTWDGAGRWVPVIRVKGRADALRRALSNLIDNAVKYGGSAGVRLARQETAAGVAARVIIRDMGPGIPQEHLENVLRPFFRVEESRSRDTGGTGLGLTIAANIIRSHGGLMGLSNHPEGGLEAWLELPAV